jgi:hypothetical protein
VSVCNDGIAVSIQPGILGRNDTGDERSGQGEVLIGVLRDGKAAAGDTPFTTISSSSFPSSLHISVPSASSPDGSSLRAMKIAVAFCRPAINGLKRGLRQRKHHESIDVYGHRPGFVRSRLCQSVKYRKCAVK